MAEPTNTEEIEKKLNMLLEEHEDLDYAINHLRDNPRTDEFRLGRMKKRKLRLKDTISILKSQLIPDEPA